jgi:hypothetical protein
VLQQDHRLQLAQFGTRRDAQLVTQRPGRPSVGAQRVRLPAIAVERPHQRRPQPFAEGMVRDGRLDVGHESRIDVAAAGAFHETGFERCRVQFDESRPLSDQERLGAELAVGLAPPQRQRGLEVGCGDRSLEPADVDRGGLDIEPVQRAVTHDRIRSEQLAQPREVREQAALGCRRRFVAPEMFDESVDPHRARVVGDEVGQHGSLHPAAERNRVAVDPHREWSESADGHSSHRRSVGGAHGPDQRSGESRVVQEPCKRARGSWCPYRDRPTRSTT